MIVQNELRQFLEYIFENREGIIYIATKDPRSEPPLNWQQHFYDYPAEIDKAISSIELFNTEENLDVFYSPALYRERAATKAAWLGSTVCWTEFDGNAPKNPLRIPLPTLVLQSSTEGHEHWYWKLSEFQSVAEDLEHLTEKITYALNADRSAWNCNKVLRLPGLRHQKKHMVSKLIVFDESLDVRIDPSEFNQLEDPPVKARSGKLPGLEQLPAVNKIVAKYRWDEKVYNTFIKPEMPVGERSSKMTYIGHACVAMGMDDIEILSVLADVDSRWKKFLYREDRLIRLHGIIVYCRSRREAEARAVEVLGFHTFLKRKVKVDWIIDGVLYHKALAILAGPPGVGKSLLSLQFCLQAGMGSNFLGWKINKPVRSMFVSMEMNYEELRSGMDIMAAALPDNVLVQLEDNFQILPVGAPLHLNKASGREVIYRAIEQNRPEVVIFDSMGMAIENINNDTTVAEAMDFINTNVREELKTLAWFIHHPRKGQVGNKKPRTLDDLYGNRYITADASVVINLWPSGSKNIFQMDFLKTRLASQADPITLRRDPNTLVTSPYSPAQKGGIVKPRGLMDL